MAFRTATPPALPTLSGLLVLLAGCSPGPMQRTPAPDVPATWRTLPASTQPVWPGETWWRGFGSPELDQLITDAEASNFTIAAAVARIRQADAQLRIAGAPLLPLVGASADASWQRVKRSSFSTNGTTINGVSLGSGGGSPYSDIRSYSAGLNASYEFDFWGRVQDQQQAAADTALFSRFDRDTVALGVVTNVANTWFTALGANDRVVVAEGNLAAAQQVLNAFRVRVQVGTATALDVSQQDSLVAGIRANIPALRSQRDQAVIGLGILTGRAPVDVTVTPGTLNTLTLPELQPGLPVDLLARRPDVAAVEAQLAAAGANVAAARAAFFPSVQLTLSGTFQSAAIGSLFGPGAALASLAGSVAQTIFDGGTLRGQLELTKGQQDELLANYRNAILQAFTDVDNALTAYQYATQQETLQLQAVAIARRSADIARAQQIAGTVDILTVLNLQTTLFSAQDVLVQVRLSRVQALLSLYKALGGGWASADTNPPVLVPGRLEGGVALPVGGNLK
jgi:multidrug efflux system outer membrane protein